VYWHLLLDGGIEPAGTLTRPKNRSQSPLLAIVDQRVDDINPATNGRIGADKPGLSKSQFDSMTDAIDVP
jgi:hypothetical protein